MRIGLVLPFEREVPNGSAPWAIAAAERAEAMGLHLEPGGLRGWDFADYFA
jgi:hypothetical protein